MTNKRGGYVKYYDFVHKYPHDFIPIVRVKVKGKTKYKLEIKRYIYSECSSLLKQRHVLYDKHETVKSHRRKFEKMYYEKQLKKVEEYFKTRSY
jgi:hypothetical protein